MLISQNASVFFVEGFIPQALANDLIVAPKDPKHRQLALIAVLVEENLLGDIPFKEAVTAYASRAQSQVPHSRAFIVSVPPDTEAFSIASMLEKLYLNGVDLSTIDGNPFNNSSSGKEDNKLAGLVLVGDLPLPVVRGEKGTHPSLYPYTDFIEKAHIYNHQTELFEENPAAGQVLPEIWHGVIRSTKSDEKEARQQLLEFFNKNKAYSLGDAEFSDVEKRLLYADFNAMQAQTNWMDYKNYDRYTRYMEEAAFNRYNKTLLKTMVAEVSSDLGSSDPILTDETIEEFTDLATEQIFQKYLLPLSEALQNHLGKVNDSLSVLGRWNEKEIDTPASLISIRDAYAQGEILRQQLLLERAIENAVKAVADPFPTVVGAQMQVTLSITGFPETSREFYFAALADGQVMSNVTDMNHCGMYRGQVPPNEEDPLKNNSVYVAANPLYNLDSLVQPPPDDVTESPEYKAYGGCVFNNSIDSEELGLSPNLCLPHLARQPLFDILGSKRVTQNLPEHLGKERCTLDQLAFHPAKAIYPPDVEQALPLDEDLFKKRPIDLLPEEVFEVIGGSLDQINPSLESILNQLYNTLLQNNLVPAEEDLILKTGHVLRFLEKTGQEAKYSPFSKVEVAVKVNYNHQEASSMILHNEPTAQTLNALYHIGEPRLNDQGQINFPPLITPDLPIDGIRGLSFYKNGDYHHFDYPNLFRVEGSRPEVVEENLKSIFEEKETELGALLEQASPVMTAFLQARPELLEPMAWKNLSPDEKLKQSLLKYLDGKETLPTLDIPLLTAPQRKPTGYEVLYIRGTGTSQGFDLALAHAMQEQDPKIKQQSKAFEEQEQEEELLLPENPPEEEGGGANLNQTYLCGDPEGVEIWEWFSALQCWFQEEVVPDENFFTLNGDYSKSFKEATAPTVEEGKVHASERVLANLLPQAASLQIEALPENGVVGQRIPFQINALDEAGQTIMGYLNSPLRLSLKNPDLGELSEVELNLFTGQARVNLNLLKAGETFLMAEMEGVESVEAPLLIQNPLELQWNAQEVIEEGRSTFYLKLRALDEKGAVAQGFKGDVFLAPLHQSDGGFINEGRVFFENGQAESQFLPVPGKPHIDLISRSPFVQSDPFSLSPSSPPAHQLNLEPPEKWPLGEGLELLVKATDRYGFTSFDYEKGVMVKVTDSTEKNIYQGLFPVQEGEAKVLLPPLQETGLIRLEFSSDTLKPVKVTLPGALPFRGSDWEGRFPRSLFVAFDGFSAGNVFAPDYLAGQQLHSGLTQAVFAPMQDPLPPALMQVDPFYRMQLSSPQQKLMVTPGAGKLSMEVFDAKHLTSQLRFDFPLNLKGVHEADPNQAPQPGHLAIQVLDEAFYLERQEQKTVIMNEDRQSVAHFEAEGLFLPDAKYTLSHHPSDAFEGLTLNVEQNKRPIARLFFALEAQSFEESDFQFIDPTWKAQPQWGGASTKEARGLAFYPQKTQEEPDSTSNSIQTPAYLKTLASGVPIGEAVRWDLPLDGILLGDPLLQFSSKSKTSLPYDYSAGQPLYRDSGNSRIVAMVPFNFNGNEFQDLAIALDDGRVRLLEGGPTDPPFKDRGDLAFLADGARSLEALDLEGDGYEDLLLATDEGRLALLHNRKEVLTRSDQTLEIGKKLYRLKTSDMDNDGYDDLITLDSRGDLNIFYYNPQNNSFPNKGMLVGNYGMRLNLNENLGRDIKIRYAGLQTPGSSLLEPEGAQASDWDQALTQEEDSLSPADKEAFFEAQQNWAEAAREDPMAALNAASPPLLPWKEGGENENYFASSQPLAFLELEKTVQNLSHPQSSSVDLGDQLKYTVQVSSQLALNQVVLADVLPDRLSLNDEPVQCIQGCNTLKSTQEGSHVFFSDLNVSSNLPVVFTYTVTVDSTPEAAFNVQTLTQPVFLNDAYKDIVVSPAYNPTAYVVQHYSTGPRSYEKRSSSEDEEEPEESALDAFDEATSALSDIEITEDSKVEDLPDIPGIGPALDEMTGANKCFESADSAEGVESCLAQKLEKVAQAVAQFGCQGSGCFPTPWNYSFLVPPQMPFPVFAAPTTLITPAGAVPSVWPVSTFLGVANIKGPINSAIRFYISPTLTGGIGLAMCWGDYSGNSTPSIAKVPIPYPPPSGNCMVTALPADKLPWGAVCTEIENQVSRVMNQLNSGISKVEGAITNLNNNPAIPLKMKQAGNEPGAGGLEMSAGVNLGGVMNYEPPVQAGSNTHLPSFDSITGVISGWVDRQTLEISNKLLSLPSITLYLPDVQNLVSRDLEKTQQATNHWLGVMSKSSEKTGEALHKIDSLKLPPGEQRFERYRAIENQASLYNTTALQGLYDIVSTLPLLHLTQVPVQLNVPWISSAEVSAYIQEMQLWLLYYEKELARVRDKWEQLTCPEESTQEAIQDKIEAICSRPGNTRCNSEEGLASVSKEAQAQVGSLCTAKQIAQRFIVDFEDVKHSVEKNIEVLHSYLNFPKQLIMYQEQVAGYVESAAGYIDLIAQLMGGWLATIQQELITWAEVIITIKEVVLNIKNIFDVFIKFDTQCSLCANERNSNFGWWSMLGLILPDLPIIEFPKWPNIVIDLSQIEASIDLEIPLLEIRPKPIPLPPLPYFSLPDFPDIRLVAKLPPIPILPGLPDLPPLPPLPPLPTFELPTLPPPPKLPDVGKSLEVVAEVIQQILNIWCLVKRSLTPIPESMLNEQISLITSRPAYLTPLDLLKIELPKIAPFDLGFNEVRIETSMYFGLRLDAMPETLKEIGKQWNDWMQVLPDLLNQQYEKSVIAGEQYVQELMDTQAEFIDQGIDFIEAEFIRLQEEAFNPFAQAEKWLRDQEAAWQEWAQEQEEKMNQRVAMSYDQYVQAVHKTNQLLGEKNDELKQKINGFMENNNDIFHVMNVFLPLGGRLEALNVYDNEKRVEGVLNLFTLKIEESLSKGPAAIYELFDDIQACLQKKENCPQTADAMSFENEIPFEDEILKKESAILAASPLQPIFKTSAVSELEGEALIQAALASGHAAPTGEGNLDQQMAGLLKTIEDAFYDMAHAPLVHHRKVKASLGVPDVRWHVERTFLDDLKDSQAALYHYQNQLNEKRLTLEQSPDLQAWLNHELDWKETGKKPEVLAQKEFLEEKESPLSAWLPSSLADEVPPQKPGQKNASLFHFSEPSSQSSSSKWDQWMSNAVPQALALEENPIPALGHSAVRACTSGLCLFDPDTLSQVPIVPAIDNPSSSQIAFLNSGHVMYSDGSTVYLKADLSVEASELNTDQGSVNIIPFHHAKLSPGEEIKTLEAVNNVQVAFEENNQVQINWKASTHPLTHGYGFQIERSILGYDADRQDNGLPDISVVLLPKDAEGNFPSVEVDGQRVESGTFITLFEEAQTAQDVFGLQANTTVTQAKTVDFPSLNNMSIELTPTRAVYIGTLAGTSHSLPLKNGYYHLEMLWFTDYGHISTRSAKQLLAPQSYGGITAPVDVGNQGPVYLPVYQQKILEASDFLIDLSAGTEYQWFVKGKGPNDGVAVVGNQLTLPPQTQPGQFEVKLVAIQKQGNTVVSETEKVFSVVIYSPKITLESEALKEGVIAGSMSSSTQSFEDDLSGLPFSVFRKREGLWKNLGHLVYQDGRLTDMAFDSDTGSYYSQNAQGRYRIENWNLENPSALLFKDAAMKSIAKVYPGTGYVEIIDPAFDKVAFAADAESPTRIALVHRATQELAGYVYYRAPIGSVLELDNRPITQATALNASGVLVADLDRNDDLLVSFLPNDAPSLPGGALLHDVNLEKPIAMVSRQGDLHFLDSSYEFILKPDSGSNEFHFFQVISPEGKPVMELFIPADFNHLEVAPPLLEKKAVPEPEPEPEPIEKEIPPNEDLPFSDVAKNNLFYSAIAALYNKGLLQGYEDGTFRPDALISRAEFVKIALGGTHCFDCTLPSDPLVDRYAFNIPFPDVNDLNAWFYFCIAIAKELGMVTGYGDGLFRPMNNISRAEAVAVLLREAKIPLINAPNGYFKDVMDSAWYKNEVYTAFTMGLLQQEEGLLKPDQEITRGEFAFMAENILSLVICEEVDTDGDGFSDQFEVANNMDPFTPDEGFAPEEEEEEEPEEVEIRMDLCPGLPEDMDGVDDGDGCPEVDSRLDLQKGGVYAQRGPLCQFIEFEADLLPGDLVMSAITDLQTKQIIYSQSEEIRYDPR